MLGWLLHLGRWGGPLQKAPRRALPPRPPWPGLASLPLLTELQGRPQTPNSPIRAQSRPAARWADAAGHARSPQLRFLLPWLHGSPTQSRHTGTGGSAWGGRGLHRRAAGHAARCRRPLPGAQGGDPGPHSQRQHHPASTLAEPQEPAIGLEPGARDTPDRSCSRTHSTWGLCGRSGSGPLGSQTWCAGACPWPGAASRALSPTSGL